MVQLRAASSLRRHPHSTRCGCPFETNTTLVIYSREVAVKTVMRFCQVIDQNPPPLDYTAADQFNEEDGRTGCPMDPIG